MADFDVLRATAVELGNALNAGTLTSQDIVKRYLAQIKAHNHAGMQLNAIRSLPPEDLLLAAAKRLDNERSHGKIRGPLHGIPIILKDAINTSSELGMRNGCGAVAFEHAQAERSAAVVDKLIEQGLIVLAKANATEFCGLKSEPPTTPGWSAMGGQTQSPYIEGGLRADDYLAGHSSAGGSSTGSGVGVAAGFSPLSLGTETSGSLVLPANRAGVYAIKATQGDIDTAGVFKISKSFDCLGAMAKCAKDVALVLEAMLEPGTTQFRKTSLPEAVQGEWKDLRVGFVDPALWRVLDWPDRPIEDCDAQIKADFLSAKDKIAGWAQSAVYPVSPKQLSGFQFRGMGFNQYIAMREFNDNFNEYVSAYTDCPVTSLQELVAWNDANADRALPKPYKNQASLLEAIKLSEDAAKASQEIAEAKQALDALSPSLQDTLNDSEIDVLVAPSDSKLCALAALYGHPCGVVPLSYLPIGQPQGLTIVAAKHREDLMLHFMGAFERSFEPRRVPPLLEK